MKPKFFLAYLRIKPLLFGVACLLLSITAINQFLNYRAKLANTLPWIVKDVVSGGLGRAEARSVRFIASRKGKEFKVKLCGISANSDESKEYLRSLLNQGDGSVVVNPVRTDQYQRSYSGGVLHQ